MKEFKKRNDLRDINTFTIDPNGARDLDDAISIFRNENGFKVYPWTVNDMDKFYSLVEMGVDGIITDFPNLVR